MAEHKRPEEKGGKTGGFAEYRDPGFYRKKHLIYPNMLVRHFRQQCPKCQKTKIGIKRTIKAPEGTIREILCHDCAFKFRTLEESGEQYKARLIKEEQEREKKDQERHRLRREAEHRAMEDH